MASLVECQWPIPTRLVILLILLAAARLRAREMLDVRPRPGVRLAQTRISSARSRFQSAMSPITTPGSWKSGYLSPLHADSLWPHAGRGGDAEHPLHRDALLLEDASNLKSERLPIR